MKRNASAPHASITSRGSTTLPLVLLIFWPFLSRTSAWMYTSWKGTWPMKCRPANIIRATQKKMMSKPVISTLVG